MNIWNEPIQFLARSAVNIERLAPIYHAMDETMRGEFFVPETLMGLANSHGIHAEPLHGSVNRPLEVKPPISAAPMMTCSYRDLLVSTRSNSRRPQIYFQFDTFKAEAQNKVSLFVCQNEALLKWVMASWPNKDVILMDDHTAEAITCYANQRANLRKVSEVNGESIGLVYMAFGDKAAAAVKSSAASLRRIGLQIPVCVIGSTPVAGLQFIEWMGESPFDGSQKKNFQFRAGRVKPKLYDLSPFERTLYVDADTEFMDDILPGFELLDQCDVAVAREDLTLQQLYNKKLAGWEINILERDATVAELGAGPHVHFLNSGVLFFRKSPATKAVMNRWHKAWMEWREWDEQLAFMRACHRTPKAKVNILDPKWNYPHRNHPGTIIFHNYGRAVVRMDVPNQQNESGIHVEDIIEKAMQAAPSWTTIAERTEVARLAFLLDPNDGVIVEIGGLYGGMTAVLGLANPKAQIIVVDDFSWSPIANQPASAARLLENVRRVGVKSVDVMEGDSRVIGKQWNKPIDLLWIDGGHSYEFVKSDLTLFAPHAKTIALHDWDNPAWPSIRQAVEEFVDEHPEWVIDHNVDTVVVLIRK